MSDVPQHPRSRPDAQSLADRDQSSADGDQTVSDLDQTTADADQLAAERDQIASDRDQKAADHDQATSDRHNGDDSDEYARTRQARSRGTRERDLSSQVRSDAARIRDESATARDHLADKRDAAAQARDALAAALDEEMERLELDPRTENGRRLRGAEILLRAVGYRKRAAAGRARAAAHREAAAADRLRAAQDRQQAADDRAAVAAELAAEGIDHLTGSLRRHVGLAAIQREMDRIDRTGESMVIAFADVVGLKRVNDGHGHAAGDELLRTVGQAITAHLRTYDLVARYGGDEFVCSLTGLDAASARERFALIADQLAATAHHPAISVGFAERHTGETLEELILRADTAMIDARRLPDGR